MTLRNTRLWGRGGGISTGSNGGSCWLGSSSSLKSRCECLAISFPVINYPFVHLQTGNRRQSKYIFMHLPEEKTRAFIPDDPDKRLLAMPLSTVLFLFGTVSLALDALHFFQVPAPVRISSLPRGAPLRPGIYPLVEDICAVDGGGGTAFRRRLHRRYAASRVFRAMLRRLGLFWALGADACAVTTAALVFGLAAAVGDGGGGGNLVDYAYTVGWVLPFVWAGPSAWATVVYVRRELRKERRLWVGEALCAGEV